MDELIPVIGARRACALTGRSRASHHRAAQGPVHGPPAPRCSPANRLTDVEFDQLLDVLNSDQFVDLAPGSGVGDPARRRDIFGAPKTRSASVAAKPPIRPASDPSSSPADRTKCGRGISRS